jgi:carbonic anhydrase/acetyltransferase-like protein (isoleucine patch superfamily)
LNFFGNSRTFLDQETKRGAAMTIYQLGDQSPRFEDLETTYCAPGVMVIGNVSLARDVNIWPYAVLRGDNEPITIGEGSNIQEHAMLHTDPGCPLMVGKFCTIGHRAILHGCTIGDNSLVGMGAIILNGAVIGNNCLVGAGALVTEGKKFPDGSLIVGSPARVVRSLDDETINQLKLSALHYVANGKRFKADLK